MGKKPWRNEPKGHQLEAFLGSQGIKTNEISTTAELIWFAYQLFGIDEGGADDSVPKAASNVNAIGKAERRKRASRNKGRLFPDSGAKPAPDTRQDITEQGLEKMMADSKPKLIDGDPYECTGDLDIDPAQLLRKVVSAVISGGQAHILNDFPEVLAFFGARIPQRSEVSDLHNVDERMFEAAEKWPNRKEP